MDLSSEKLKHLLNLNADVLVFELIGSTNVYAEEIAAQTDKPIIIVSESQTDGRGRNGKTFFSPDTGLYLSLVTHPKSDFFSLTTITCGTAVAVCRAIEKLTDLKPQIKWVNDIYIDNKKVSGILCRALGGNGKIEHLITGIGINIYTKDFPDEIKNTAGSLNVQIDRNQLTAEIVNQIMKLSENDYMDEYRKKSCVIGKEITYFIDGIAYNGKAVDIDENGGLIVINDDKKITLTGGEITVRFSVD
ncbi:MAG: biotin--[acetyl-CoA-carboxylase] ligase [Clostridia bacterium]|nr:biotin--[acetyl-CoA-carboxylase] ligase [Clostridia bacterium]